MLPVLIPPAVQEQLREEVLQRGSKNTSGSATSFEDAVELITQVLRQDIRGVHQGRGKQQTTFDTLTQQATGGSADSYNCTLDGLDIEFATTSNGILVHSIRNNEIKTVRNL